ncbi:xanthine dehydrogenase accessory protein XdhC [Marinicella meishanensis]|uniref:xanthine dehydrogenase accessory protein XdhC n=1 Tax=Marinicella meishanensis TaxID=2873263 RepID=UPI001CBA9BC4|nr:xanthine dehydrogenase accessory protein XdhC [Marinicella sp. NBU2979]
MSRHLLHHRHVQSLIEQRIDFVSVVVINMQGSAPQEPGAKMLVTADCQDSPLEGTIGGGKLERFAIQHAQRMLQDGGNKCTDTLTLNLQQDIGMSCGGVVQLFFECVVHDHWHIVVFGAGHVAQALIPLLLTLPCRVHCIDARRDWLDRLPDSPALVKINQRVTAELVAELPPEAYLIAVTQGHCEDAEILAQAMHHHCPPYIGVIGSDSKAAILKKDLRQRGIRPEWIERIHCPIGLPLGDDVPAEIAISITAQLLAVRDTTP